MFRCECNSWRLYEHFLLVLYQNLIFGLFTGSSGLDYEKNRIACAAADNAGTFRRKRHEAFFSAGFLGTDDIQKEKNGKYGNI
jgi:hypothetical protein